MSLSAEDRQWVKDMIAMATAETLNQSRDFARQRVDGHAKGCPNLQRLKWLCIGLGIGLGVSAPQIVKGILGVFTA